MKSHRDAVRLAVCLAFVAGLLLSPKLWLSSRSYPLMPVWTWLPAVGTPLDVAVFAALLLLLGAAAIVRKPAGLIAGALAIGLGLALLDQTRWQPWYYQYCFMLAALAMQDWRATVPEPPPAALDTCRVIVACVYLWSGLHKVNRTFVNSVFPWFLGGISVPTEVIDRLVWLGAAVPIVEVGIGVGLLTTRFRRAAIVAAVLMHLFILVSVGPLGHDIDRAVWPWNLAMIAFDVLLFWDATRGTREILSPRHGWFHVAILALFGVLPALSFVHLWDSYLSFALFSGDTKSAQIFVSDAVRDALPAEVRMYVTPAEPGRNLLNSGKWAMDELKAPGYPEERIFRRLAMYGCGRASAPSEVELVVAEPSSAEDLKSLIRRRLDQPTFRAKKRYDCDGVRSGSGQRQVLVRETTDHRSLADR